MVHAERRRGARIRASAASPLPARRRFVTASHRQKSMPAAKTPRKSMDSRSGKTSAASSTAATMPPMREDILCPLPSSACVRAQASEHQPIMPMTMSPSAISSMRASRAVPSLAGNSRASMPPLTTTNSRPPRCSGNWARSEGMRRRRARNRLASPMSRLMPNSMPPATLKPSCRFTACGACAIRMGPRKGCVLERTSPLIPGASLRVQACRPVCSIPVVFPAAIRSGEERGRSGAVPAAETPMRKGQRETCTGADVRTCMSRPCHSLWFAAFSIGREMVMRVLPCFKVIAADPAGVTTGLRKGRMSVGKASGISSTCASSPVFCALSCARA